MAYKDKDRQREADKARQRRRRDKIKVKGVTNIGVTAEGVTEALEVVAASIKVLPKRGKDIKCFEDLPPDVRQTIDRMSDTPEDKLKRTATAINYQHIFPNRYDPTGRGGPVY